MPTCPECYSHKVGEGIGSPEEINDGQGYEWRVIHHYYCENCGCEWTETLHTTREVEVNKLGDCLVSLFSG